MLKFEFLPTFNELLVASYIMSAKNTVVKTIVIGLFVASCVLMGIIFYFRHYLTLIDWVSFMAINLAKPIGILISTIFEYKRVIKHPIKFEINQQNIKITQGTMSIEIGWDNMARVEKLGEMLGFYFRKNCAQLIPTRVINNQQILVIGQICHQNNTEFKV